MEIRVERARRNAIGTSSERVTTALVIHHHQIVWRRGQSEGAAATQQGRGGVVVGQITQTDLTQRRFASLRVGPQQRREAPLHRRRMGLPPERLPQVVEALLRLVAEGAPVSGVGGQAGIDDLRVVMVVQLDHHAARPIQRAQNVFRIRRHQIGEVGRAERRRQPQVALDVSGRRHHQRAHKPQIGDRLVELGIDDRRQRRIRLVIPRLPCHAPTRLSAPRGPTAGSPADGNCSSAGTGMSYIFAALSPRIFFF